VKSPAAGELTGSSRIKLHLKAFTIHKSETRSAAKNG